MRHDRRDDRCVPLPSTKALLTEIRYRLRLVLGRNTEDDAGWGGDLEDDIFFKKMSRLGVELDMDDDWVPHCLRWREELRKIKKCE